MKYGFFDDSSREYVINVPSTPLPWINYLGSEDFFGLVSNTAGGYCFFRDARLRRITRYRYNNIPADCGGRYYYIKDGDTVWNPGWMPVKTPLDSYECRHGLGYTRIVGEKNGLRAELLLFVPMNARCEVHQLTITNLSQAGKEIDVFSFIEFCLWDAMDDATNFQRNFSTGEVEVEGGTIFHKTEYRERRNHYAFYSVNREMKGFDTARDNFLGHCRGLHEPEVVMRGESTNSIASGGAPVGSHHLSIALKPGRSETLSFVLGYAENAPENKFTDAGKVNKEAAYACLSRFDRPVKVEQELTMLQDEWTNFTSRIRIQSSDPRLDRMVNTWNPYQCMVTFNLSRSASYFESGIGRGMGFRDSNQDILGIVHTVPERARQRILDIAATQFTDGGNWHQYQPLTKTGNSTAGSGFNDDPLWLILAVSCYIKETGDWGILEECVPFSDSTEEANLLDHCSASMRHVEENLGPHGLPLIGRADWNDCLNLNCFSTEPGESFQTCANKEGRTAESLVIAALYIGMAREYANMCRRCGRDTAADRTAHNAQVMEKQVCDHGWDGEWFLRAYDFFGQPVGGSSDAEGRIYIEPQGLMVMAGVGNDNGMAKKALDSVNEKLNTRYGIVLLDPPYTRYDKRLGEITSYPPGYKENGGIFCHNNPWVAIAEALAGNPERAWAYYRQICPAYIEDISDVHRTEPYVYSQMIAGKAAPRHGEAKNSWLTGTAAWNFAAVTQYLLGIRPDWDGLRIAPVLPDDIPGFSLDRRFRGTTYRIEVRKDVEADAPILRVDGQTVEGNLVLHEPGRAEASIECILAG